MYFYVIIGVDNNGGIGLVAAVRLHLWDRYRAVILPKGDQKLLEFSTKQLNWVQRLEIKIIRDLPTSSSIQGSNSVVLECYFGYAVSRCSDKISEDHKLL